MKLYYKPGACSLASHIALREAGVDFTLEKVDTKAGKTESGEDYSAVNPNGYVPALRLDGVILTEGPAVLQHLAERFPNAGLLPAEGTLERANVLSFLNFTGTELHKAFSPLFQPNLSAEARETAIEKIAKRMSFIEKTLSDGRPYLAGNKLSIADLYTYVVATWTAFVQIDLAQWPHVAAFVERIGARPTVIAARKAEGIAA